MATVATVAGPVDASELGLTLIHEHFISADEMVSAQWPHLRDPEDDYGLALSNAGEVKRHGVRTVVDPTAAMLGRDVRGLARLATDSGLYLVTCTGIYTYEHLPRFLAQRSADFMAQLFVHDIERGIQGTDIKAAFIKCAADEPGLTKGVEKVHRAAARASLATGAPIMAHSHPATRTGLRQVELFLEEGVAPEKLHIAHTGDTDDLAYIDELLVLGVYIGMDRYGLDYLLPTAQRNAVVLEFARRGYLERMFLSQDFSPPIAAGLDWYPPEAMERSRAKGFTADWSMTFLFNTVIPQLRQAGLSEVDLHTLMVDNPARWLGGA
jgi:phosphotriesterase-related protein